MSELVSTEAIVTFDVLWEHGKLLSAATDSPEINHFLDFLKLTQSYNTWVNYVFDLKCFFTVTHKLPSAITRADCLAFMQAQDQAGYADATINRRLAAVSSLFNELTLLDGERFPHNPIYPRPLKYSVINPNRACIAVKHNGCQKSCPKTNCKPFLLLSPVGVTAPWCCSCG